MSGQHTKGPWHWRVSRKGKSVHLVAADGVGTFVMGFVRFGTQSAQPQFNAVGRMETAADLAVDIPGQEHNNTWNQTLAHPDARLIAAAPQLLASLEAVLAIWLRDAADGDGILETDAPALAAARDALVAAKGGAA